MNRSRFLFAISFFTLGRAGSGQTMAQSADDTTFSFGRDQATSRPFSGDATSQPAATDPTSQPKLPPGKDLAHWSGLPIWEKEARELGFELPLPLGAAANVFSAKHNFDVPKVTIG